MITWTFEQFDSLDSTMNIIHDRARDNASEGLVVTAKLQTSGRGRSGNVWVAPEGNLNCSILLRPEISARDAGQYSFLTAVALARSFDDYIKQPHKFEHKWPNDVLIDQKKGAGILLESEILPNGNIAYLNIGVGVNLKFAPEGRIALSDICENAEQLNVETFLPKFLGHFNDLNKLYKSDGFAPIRAEWLHHAHGLNHPIKVRMPNEMIDGIFRGIRDDGALHLELPNGQSHYILSGDVFFGWDDQLNTQPPKGYSHASRG